MLHTTNAHTPSERDLDRSSTTEREAPGSQAGYGDGVIEAVLDLFWPALMIVDRKGELRFANRAAQELLQQHDVIRKREGCLDTGDPERNRQLRSRIEKICDGGVGPDVMCLIGGSACFLAAISAINGHRDLALLTISDPGEVRVPSGDFLSRLYGLSACEIEVATDLARGLTPMEIARRRQTTVHTVRTQLKQIYRKMHTSRQSELVAKLSLCGLRVLRDLGAANNKGNGKNGAHTSNGR